MKTRVLLFFCRRNGSAVSEEHDQEKSRFVISNLLDHRKQFHIQ